MAMRWVKILFCTLLCIPATSIQAAEFIRSNNSTCAIFMNGEILAGDSKKFDEIASSLGLFNGKLGDYIFNEKEEAICLNSRGGSWDEGRTIAEKVSDFGITTRVSAGDECLSACSLIFMAGRFRGAEFDGPSRYLHVQGRLGFHGPYLVPSEDQHYSASEMQAVSVMQNRIISDFIRFGSSGYAFSYRGSIAMSLVGDMLAHGPAEILYADTVERIARWNISLEGAKQSIRLNKNRLFQACENVLNFPFDRPARTITPDVYQNELDVEVQYLISSYGDAKVFGKIQFSGDANRICLIQMNDNGGTSINMDVKGISICTDNGDTGVRMGNCPDYADFYPYYYALPPETTIVSLAKKYE
jgi:hypothetical protein